MYNIGVTEKDALEQVRDFFKKYPRSTIYEIQETYNGIIVCKQDKYNRKIAETQKALGV